MMKFAIYQGDNIVARADAFEVLAGGVLKAWDTIGNYPAQYSVMLFPAGQWTYAGYVEDE